MPASFGEFREGLQEMTGHSAEKVSVKGCIDEILHWTILEVQLSLRSQSSDSQHSFPSFSSMSDGDEVLFAFHEIASPKQMDITSVDWNEPGVAFLVCVGGVFLVEDSSSVGPGLSPDQMSFTSTRTAGILVIKMIFLLKICQSVLILFFSLKGQPWLELFKIVMWNRPDSPRSKTVRGQFRAWWVSMLSKRQN